MFLKLGKFHFLECFVIPFSGLIFKYYNECYRQPLPDDMPEQEGEDQEEEGPSDNYCDFTVFVAETNSKKGLIVEATSMDTEIAFNTILCADDMAKLKAMPRFERSL